MIKIDFEYLKEILGKLKPTKSNLKDIWKIVKKYSTPRNLIIVGSVVVVILISLFTYYMTYYRYHNNDFSLDARYISVNNLYDQNDDEYVIFLHRGDCIGCTDMQSTLSEYQKDKTALPLYLTDLNKIDDKQMKKQFINIDLSMLIYVKDGKETYRWFGIPPIKDIPTTEGSPYIDSLPKAPKEEKKEDKKKKSESKKKEKETKPDAVEVEGKGKQDEKKE